jgi:uncharacterized protein (TIGR02594 family)
MTNVLAVQRALLARGYKLGPKGADGDLGRYTITALKKFQADQKLDIKYPGTIGPKTLAALGIEAEPSEIVPPWVAEARRKIGLQEKRDNKTLREWLKSDGNTLGDPSKLPWCGDFMETVIAKTLPDEPIVSNPYWALNWQKFGVPLKKIALGAVAPFKRPSGGHIGMIVGHDKTYFHVLGGNQSNAVTVTKIAKSRLAGPLRWPKSYPLPAKALATSSINATVSTNEA